MSDMIERAAKAIWDVLKLNGVEWEDRVEQFKNETRAEARAALLAALDPDDEELVYWLSGHIADAGPDNMEMAAAAIAALRKRAQGERTP